MHFFNLKSLIFSNVKNTKKNSEKFKQKTTPYDLYSYLMYNKVNEPTKFLINKNM